MQVVARVVRRQEFLRIAWILSRGIEIDHAVEGLTGAYPPVQRLAIPLANVGVVRRAIEWRERSAVDLQPPRVSLRDHLLVAGNDVLRSRCRIRSSIADVVDTFHHHDVRNTRLRESVVLESRECI